MLPGRERRQELDVEQLTHAVVHVVVMPRVTIGVGKQLGRHEAARLKVFLAHEALGGHALDRFYLALGHLAAAPIAHVTYLIGAIRGVDVADGEEQLVLVGARKYAVVHQLAILIVEIEAQSPQLGGPSDHPKIVGALLATLLFYHRTDASAVYFYLNAAFVIMNLGELFLLPRRFGVHIVAVHHASAVGMALL